MKLYTSYLPKKVNPQYKENVMENAVKLTVSCAEIEWSQQNRENVANLRIPQTPSAFPSKAKHLCESGVDLVCGITSKPSSG